MPLSKIIVNCATSFAKYMELCMNCHRGKKCVEKKLNTSNKNSKRYNYLLRKQFKEYSCNKVKY